MSSRGSINTAAAVAAACRTTDPAPADPGIGPGPGPDSGTGVVDESVHTHGADTSGAQNERAVTPSNNDEESIWSRVRAFYHDNIGLLFVAVAQIFASIMAMTTRLLETGFETKFHALQVIFVRMAITAVIGSLYMWYRHVPDSPLGPPGTRGLLVFRGLSGSLGLFGLYYSLSYLDIADSTVITFLVPTLTSFVCWVALREPFTTIEAFAGILALTGVLFIARPDFLFSHLPRLGATTNNNNSTTTTTNGIFQPVPSTPSQRSFAVILAVFGSLAAASAYATIRVIGSRVHSLVSVNYFAVLATLTSSLVLLLHPDLGFQVPQSTSQWLLLLSIGLSGFLFQVLLTKGLQKERAGRATNMILVSALIIERIVWGTTPPFESFIGSALIIGAAIWVGLQKKNPAVNDKPSPVADEETSLLPPRTGSVPT